MTVSVNPVRGGGGENDLNAILKAVDIAVGMYGAKLNREQAERFNQMKLEQAKQAQNDALSADEKKFAFETAKQDKALAFEAGQRDLDRKQQASLALAKNALKVPNTQEGKVKNLNASEKSRYDNIIMASKAIQDMGAALGAGQNTYSWFGDNDFTISERDFVEALGRMQSGGAITDYEEKKFKNMAPKFMDAPEVRASKLIRLQEEMNSRLKTLGFDPGSVEELAGRVSPVRKNTEGTATAAPSYEKMTKEQLDQIEKNLKERLGIK